MFSYSTLTRRPRVSLIAGETHQMAIGYGKPPQGDKAMHKAMQFFRGGLNPRAFWRHESFNASGYWCFCPCNQSRHRL